MLYYEFMQDLALILNKDGLLPDSDLARLQQQSLTTGVAIEVLIEKSGIVKPWDLVKAKAKLYNVGYVEMVNVAASPEALAKIPESVAEHYLVFPFAYDSKNRELSVAMANPLDLQTIAFLEAKSQSRVKPFMAVEADLTLEIPKRYAQSLSAEVTQVLKEAGDSDFAKRIVDVEKIGDVIREAPIAKIVATVLEFAVKSRASDVHIEPLEEHTRVRYRIDGILQEKLVLPKKVHDAVVSRVKILAELKIDERRIPQDGALHLK